MGYMEIARQWKSRSIQSTEDMDTVLENYRILFAYHSNKIEDAGVSWHDTREIFENGRVTNYSGDVRHIFETQNQKACYDWLKGKIVASEPLTPKLICRIHAMLMYGCYDETRWQEGERPGEYKKHMYGVGLSAGLEPDDVPHEIAYICDEIRSLPDSWETDLDVGKILTAASFLHCNFEYVHPFADGNGRAGRTIMNYYLMIHDLPPAVIFDEDRKLYYEALTVFDETEKLDGFIGFLKDETVKTWQAKRRMPSSGKLKTMLLL